MKMKTCMTGLVLLVIAVPFSPALGQLAGSQERQTDWQAYFTTGYFDAGTVLNTQVRGESVKVEMDEGWLFGVRAGADQEFFGLEALIAGVISDMDLIADPAANLTSGHDASVFLADVNLLWFPVGNSLADGRVRPFATIGTGLGIFDTDFYKVENEAAWDFNVGGGIKFLLGDQGNPILRFDYRWHIFTTSSSGLNADIYRQELTMGLGFRF